MPVVIVDGREIEIGAQERLNGIQAAKRAGVEIPHYCWHPGLSVVASCRMCLVENGRRDPQTGKVTMQPKLVPACQTPAGDGSVFVTNSEKVAAARAMVEEDLLLRHPVDCPICDKAGECLLQDYHFLYGRDKRRADIKPFNSRRRSLGETVTLFVDRCVMCTRCVRFCREATGTSELMVTNRGSHEEIDVFPGFPLENKLSGNVVDLCPVGALGDKDFLYQQRVWFMKSHNGVCPNCSTGCSIKIEENNDHVYRLKPRENPHVNQWWMCDLGRYGWKHVHSPDRWTAVEKQTDHGARTVEWSDAVEQLDSLLRTSQRLAAAISPWLTVEEAWLLARYLREIDPQAVLALGYVPLEGEDERYPNGFTIRAEKCPNRRGVEKVLAGVGGDVCSFSELAARTAAGEFGAVWVTGGYPGDWIPEPDAQSFAKAPQLIVQDLFSSPLGDAASWRLPAGAFVEREGSFVNHADRLQSFGWAIRPPAGVQVEGPLYWRLLGKSGLYNARRVLDDVARDIGYFAAAAGPVPEVGVDLKVNMLAAV